MKMLVLRGFIEFQLLNVGTPVGTLVFLYVSSGSLSELDTQLELARLGYLTEEQWTALDAKLTEEDKVLAGLIKQQKDSSK